MAKEKDQWNSKFHMIHATTVRNGSYAVALKLEVERDSRIVYTVLSPDEAIQRGKELLELGERLKGANERAKGNQP